MKKPRTGILIITALICLSFVLGLSLGTGSKGTLTVTVTTREPSPTDREITLLVDGLHDFSFPSGHTIASFEAATALLLGNRKLGIPAMILAVLIAFSRLYLYVHYPTDVLTSIVLGIGIAFLGTFLVKKGYALWESRKQAA